MKLVIRTPVDSYYKDILPQLSRKKLFEWASLLFGAKLVRFEGHHEHDEYQLHFYFPFVEKKEWIGFVSEYFEDDERVYFVDEAKILPFFLASWKHKHLFERIDGQASMIVDDIDYTTPSKLGDYALLPLIYSHFFLRKSVYKVLFGKGLPSQQLRKLIQNFLEHSGWPQETEAPRQNGI